MTKTKFLLWASVLLLCGSCSAFNIGSDIQAGRQALIGNQPELALSHFQRAVQADPNYIVSFGVFEEGAWTYVGRANYAAGRFSEARSALERALAQDANDNLARLYLGLVLARSGDTTRGAAEIEKGLNALHSWFEHISYNTFYGQFWDPRREIRSEIKATLTMLSGNNVDWPKLITNGDWIGSRFEEEIDLARRQEINEGLQRYTDT